METKQTFYFYNQRGRKIAVSNKFEAEKLIRQGFLQTTPDSPPYNPVYDKGGQDLRFGGQVSSPMVTPPIVNKPTEVKVTRKKRVFLEVLKI